MKKILPVIILLLVASSAAYATGIGGTWKAKMQGPNGDMELAFVFKMTDGKLSGVVRTPNGDTEITNSKKGHHSRNCRGIDFFDLKGFHPDHEDVEGNTYAVVGHPITKVKLNHAKGKKHLSPFIYLNDLITDKMVQGPKPIAERPTTAHSQWVISAKCPHLSLLP